MKSFSFILAVFFLSGCASYTSMPFEVGSASLPCEAFEARPSMLSTVAGAICFGKDGKPIGMIGGTGTSQASIMLEILQAGSIVGAGGIIAHGYEQGLKASGKLIPSIPGL